MEEAELENVLTKKNNRKTPVPTEEHQRSTTPDPGTNSTSQPVEDGEEEPSADEIDGPGHFEHEKWTTNSTNIETEDTTSDQQPLSSTKKESILPKTEKANEENTRNKTIFLQICIIIGLLLALICKLWVRPAEIITEPKLYTCDAFMQLKDQYPQLDAFLWNTLKVNVDNALYKNPGQPGTFIFLYNTSNTENEFMKNIVRITKNCAEEDIQPINLASSDLNTPEFIDDHGLFITKYRDELKKNQIMVVHDLSQISPEVVQAFHSFCDVYEPIVEKALIFFTLDIRKADKSILKSRNPIKISEEYLHALWNSSLKSHILEALITRMTENVFFIY